MSYQTDTNRHPQRVLLSKVSRASVGGVVTVDRVASALRISPQETSIKLAGLVRRGWLTRLKRGLYYVLPLDAQDATTTAIPDPWVLAEAAFAPCYIAGWSAAEHWHLTEQIFHSTFVVTTQKMRATSTRLLGSEFHFAHVSAKRFGHGLVKVWRGEFQVSVSTPETTIVDALRNPEWVGGIRHLVEIIKTYREDHRDFSLVWIEAQRAKKGVIFKRLGFILENFWPKEESLLIDRCRMALSRGYAKLDPTIKTKGKIVRRWGLWVNANISR